MRINVHTDYALRLLMFLAVEQKQASVDQVALAYGISRNHLVKVAARLTVLGLIVAKRGRGGGLMLAQRPEDINVGAVVRSIENFGNFVECFNPSTNRCRVTGVCGLQGALHVALQDFLARLDRYTLADLVPDPLNFRNRLI